MFSPLHSIFESLVVDFLHRHHNLLQMQDIQRWVVEHQNLDLVVATQTVLELYARLILSVVVLNLYELVNLPFCFNNIEYT